MSNLLTDDIVAALKPREGRNLIITAGNTFRCDDGVGPCLAGMLQNHEGLHVIDAGFTPENIIDDVIALNPDYIVVIDAADFQGRPGEVRVIEETAIPQTTLSTHAIPLNVITRIIQESTQAEIVFLGIQVRSVMMGEDLSPEVKKSADLLCQEIKKYYRHLT